jgi:hypothetical protein
MLTKVRQFRELSARLNNDLRVQHDSIQNSSKRGPDDASDDPNAHSQDGMYRQQVLHGASILEKTSQSIER